MRIHPHLLASTLALLQKILCEGQSAETTVQQALKSHAKWGSRDRKFVAETVYDLIRWLRWYAHLAGLPTQNFSPEALCEPKTLFRLWAAKVAYLEQKLPEGLVGQAWSLPADFTVESVQQRAEENVPLAVRQSLPDWIDKKGQQAYGAAWQELAAALNQPADVFLRCNTLRTTPETLTNTLEAAGFPCDPVPDMPLALRMRERRPLQQTKAFKDGWFEVQDVGSQRIMDLLAPQAGERIADGCAGAGGKSLQLAAALQNTGYLLALDVVDWKIANLRQRAERAGARIYTKTLSTPEMPVSWRETFDAVLVDAPCSGLGVLRRLPDTKWKMTTDRLGQLLQLQRQILMHQSTLVRPGGRLIYATCSILPQENEEQVAGFLENHPAWRCTAQQHVLPHQSNSDGFFAARLERHS